MGGTFKYSLDKLYILQKRAVRIISHVNWRHHSEPSFKELGILTIKDIHKYVTAQFMYRSHNSLLPPIFGNFVTQNYDIHDHDTRQKKTNIYIHKDSHLRLVEEQYDVTECLLSTKLSHWMSP